MVYLIPSDLAAVMRGPYTARIVADAFYDGQPTLTNVPVERSGSIGASATSRIQTSAKIKITSDAMVKPGDTTLAPRNAVDALATYGQEIALRRQVYVGPRLVGSTPLGLFRISSAPDVQEYGKNIRGSRVITSVVVELELDDRFEPIDAADFARVQVPAGNATVWSEIRRFSPFPIIVNPDVRNQSVARTMVYQDSRLDTISDLLSLANAAPVFTREGNLTAKLIDPIGAGQTPVDLTGTIQPFSRSMSNDYKNHIVVTNTNDGATQTIAEAMVSAGPLRYNGPAGDRVERVDSGLSSSVTASRNLADARLAAAMQGRAAETKVTCLPNDAIELYDPVTATDPSSGNMVTGWVSGYSKPLDPTDLMTVTVSSKVYS